MKEKDTVIFEKKCSDGLFSENEHEKEVQQILDAGCEEEAKRIEAYAMKNQITMTPEEQERMHLAILQRVKQEQKLLREREEEKKSEKQKRTVMRKVAVAAACVVVMLFGMSLTSEGNHLYLKNFWKMEAGDVTKKKTNNDEERQQWPEWEEEQKARAKIETALSIRIPEFFYMPEGICYSSYELDEVLHLASIKYEYKGNVVWLNISDSQINSSEGSVLDGRYLETLQADAVDEKVKIELYSACGGEEGSECYRADWTYKNVQYSLGAKMKKEKFYKILKKMKI